ncbi:MULTISPECIES: hypothetical protein [unclassified Sphingomonas]|uniref:hypothetical protein n=1 Tax=unclassified Sphingomonas TaxID=196159 RepID=UPI002864A4B0|nr:MULTISPECIES: hypothetical protein [unclassified Sphingomonas]MDR6115050.1 hypothetical protein [Sphingomonas sp. SORGH_AS_0789]MDR6151276.1 hypothetical protein [Sphingomonas sp. SORGH_AS_0742]
MEFIKPLRNYLRPYNTVSFLQAIWYLSNHLEFGMDLPRYLAGANPNGLRSNLALGFFLWELDTLAREVILHCEPRVGRPITEWGQVAKALNLLKRAEEEGSTIDEHNVMSEMTRIAHRQFHWQQGVSHNDLIRTRKIYRSNAMNDVVRTVYGLSAEQVALSGFAALATYIEHFAMTADWCENVVPMLGFNPRPVIENLTVDLATIRKSAHDARSLNGDWAYAFNPLWLHPLIRIEDSGRIICPIPGLLARRMTDGLYFDVAGHDVDVLSAHMGPAYQAYIGEALDRANKGRFSVLPEQPYGSKKQPKDAVDFIVVDDTASLFVETKLLKVGRAAKEYLAPDAAVTTQLAKLAKAIGQIYATLSDALAGQYPHWKPNGKPVHPVLVTMDNWNLFTHTTHGDLNTLVLAELDRRKIDRSIITDHQYVVCSANEFEVAIQVMHQVGIQQVMEPLSQGEKVGWLFSGHLRQSFSKELQSVVPLFPEERRSLLPKPPA